MVNFHTLEVGLPTGENTEVQIPFSSVLEATSRYEHSLFDYFLGEKIAFPVVEQYVKNVWKKFGIVKAMKNLKGFLLFQIGIGS